MDIQTDINWIKAQLDKVHDVNLINALKQLLTYANNKRDEEDFSVSLSEVDKKKLNQAINSLVEGEGISHSEVMEQTKNKFPDLFK